MDARRGTALGAATALVGALASGPLGLWLVGATHPQPAWRDPATFVRAYHDVQAVPYFAGFLLVAGFVMLVAGLHRLAPEPLRVRTTWALVFVAIFAAMIFVNYAIQTSWIPALVEQGAPGDETLAGALTMANPRSLGWALEMWGYAVLGVATWCGAPVLSTGARERAAAVLCFANGPLSIAAAVATALHPGWVTTGIGLASFALWNVLIVALTSLVWLSMRERSRA